MTGGLLDASTTTDQSGRYAICGIALALFLALPACVPAVTHGPRVHQGWQGGGMLSIDRPGAGRRADVAAMTMQHIAARVEAMLRAPQIEPPSNADSDE